jgi:MFS family permease
VIGRDPSVADLTTSMEPAGSREQQAPLAGPAERPPGAVLAAALLFNVGQGVLRPSLPLYLQHFFGANYRMITLIPVVFGAGKWIASLPTGYLIDQLGRRRLMVAGLLAIAVSDVASVVASTYGVFLSVRGVGGMGWAMFGTVATTIMLDRSGGRGRAISLLLMSETCGLLLGSLVGGWLYQHVAATGPFFFEAACMLIAAAAVGWRPLPTPRRAALPDTRPDWRLLRNVLRTRGVVLMSLTSATLTAVQTGALVFLFPLYLVERAALSPAAVGYVVGLGVFGRLAALWFAGCISDRHDRLRLLALGLAGYGVVLGTVTVVTDPVSLGLWSAMIGAGAGFAAGLPAAVVGDRVAPPFTGIAVGWLRMVTDAGMLLGPVALGALADALQITAPFLCAALLVSALAWWCHREADAVRLGSSPRGSRPAT